MRRKIYYTPLSQEPVDIKTQIRDYLKFGKPLQPVIKTEVIIPKETKNFIWGVVGAVAAGVVLYQVLK